MTTESDAAAFLDPFIFCLGFLLVAVGIMLSQVHRDEGILLPISSGLPFNILRKLSGLSLFAGVILGFWVVGVWWLLWLPVLVVLSGFAVQLVRNARNRLPITMTLMAIGLCFVIWAQGPTLRDLGVIPHF